MFSMYYPCQRPRVVFAEDTRSRLSGGGVILAAILADVQVRDRRAAVLAVLVSVVKALPVPARHFML